MKLSKQQQRRIKANIRAKIDQHDHENIATVVSHLGFQLILSHQGELIRADWRKQSQDIACNDRVIVHRTANNDGAVVEAILPRKNMLHKWQGRKTKPIAANIDQILIVIAPAPMWQENLIDRYLIAAREAGIAPALLLNKIDCLDAQSEEEEEMTARLAPYQNYLGVPLFKTSVMQGALPADLLQWLDGKQSILCGQSGVGKSSLVRVLKPDCDIWVQSISQASGLGKHTTTNLRLYPLENEENNNTSAAFSFQKNSAIIDTPGVRGFAVCHLTREDILNAFPDITHYANQCRFSDCAHQNTPHCAVESALSDGAIVPARFHSLQQLLSEVNP